MRGPRTRTLIRIGIGALISAFFLWLVFRQIDLAQVIIDMKAIQAVWVVPAILVYFAGVWVRTTRWSILMRPLSKQKTHTLFPIYIISYMANNILPMRIGDIYRAYIAGKKLDVSKSASLVTIGVERIFDGLTMLALLLISILFFPISNPIVRKVTTFGSVFFLGAILICYLLIVKKDWADRIFRAITGKTRLGNHPRLKEVFDNLFHGLDSLKTGGDILRVIFLSAATWLIEAASYYLVLNAFGFFGSFLVAVATMAMVNLVIIVPSAPGYFGPFELACFIILGSSGYGALTGFSETAATAYALIVHVVVQWIPSTVLGLVFMWREHISFSEIESN